MIAAAIAFATLRHLGADLFLQLGVIVVGAICEAIYLIDFFRKADKYIKNG